MYVFKNRKKKYNKIKTVRIFNLPLVSLEMSGGATSWSGFGLSGLLCSFSPGPPFCTSAISIDGLQTSSCVWYSSCTLFDNYDQSDRTPSVLKVLYCTTSHIDQLEIYTTRACSLRTC